MALHHTLLQLQNCITKIYLFEILHTLLKSERQRLVNTDHREVKLSANFSIPPCRELG